LRIHRDLIPIKSQEIYVILYPYLLPIHRHIIRIYPQIHLHHKQISIFGQLLDCLRLEKMMFVSKDQTSVSHHCKMVIPMIKNERKFIRKNPHMISSPLGIDCDQVQSSCSRLTEKVISEFLGEVNVHFSL
jgi:hypothetical protein